MKKIKNIALKRIVIYLCCTVLLSSSFFMSYQVPVYAETTYGDLLRDAVYVAGAAAGIFFSGGTLTPALLIPFIEALAGTGFDVYDYVTQDETAGTTTISADFVNLVLQAYQQYREENGEKFDGVMEPGSDGYYHYDSLLLVKSGWNIAYPDNDFDLTMTYTDINTFFPMAVVVYSNRTSSENSRNQISRMYGIFYNKTENEFYAASDFDVIEGEESLKYNFSQALSGYLYVGVPQILERYTKSGNTRSWENYVFFGGSTGGHPPTASLEAYSSSIPVYHSLSAAMDGLRTGDFSGAYNYGKVPECETPAYTGTYDGGDITVPTEKLEGIQDKLDEIDQTDKDIYEKLKELLEWLLGNGGIGGGTDMTATNLWLEKIYLKVCQIYDKMNSAVEGAEQTALTKIQESLDEIIVQLKKIKRWTAIDTVVDGVDAIADWLDLIRGVLKDAKEGAGSAVAAIASGVGDSVDLMAKKFPFSIPWDILFFVSVLSAEPQVPYFEIPFNIELSALDITIDYTMKLDFSQLQWLSDLSRLLLSMTYAVGLMKLTFGVTSVGKEE